MMGVAIEMERLRLPWKKWRSRVREGMEIKKLWEESGTRVVVSPQHRHGEHYRKVKEIIAAGALDRILHRVWHCGRKSKPLCEHG
jgi:predicted dehydrogenase